MSIKPYISPAERHIESILLKEHHESINSGVNRKDIKVRKNQLFRGQVLVGEVIDSSYRPATSDSQEGKKFLEVLMKRMS